MKTKIHFLIVLSMILAQLTFSVQATHAQELPPAPAEATAGIDPGWLEQAQDYISRSEYFFTLSAQGAHQAPNRAQGLRFAFSQDNLHISERQEAEPTWNWSLRPALSNQALRFAPGSLSAVENRLAFAYAEDVQVEYTNTASGLAQRVLLVAPREFTLALESDLSPHRTGEDAFEFRQGAQTRLTYRLARVVDARGRELPAHLEIASADGKAWQVQVKIEAAQADYPLEIELSINGAHYMPDWVMEGDPNQRLGWGAAPAGDVNGDGYSDVILSAPWYSGFASNIGRVMVFYGSATGLSYTPGWVQNGVNAAEQYGFAVASAGDVNGDGYSDVLIATITEYVHLYLGGPGGLSTTTARIYTDDQVNSDFGSVIGTAGDVNGDGYSDFFISAAGYMVGEDWLGRVYVHYGDWNGPDYTVDAVISGPQDDAGFGFSVATAGDVNGDGCAELLVGLPSYVEIFVGRIGAAHLYAGSPSGLSTAYSWIGKGPGVGSNYGWSVHTAGDVNGDGYSDFAVGAIYTEASVEPGYVYVYHGRYGWPDVVADWVKEGASAGSMFGSAVGAAGDVNGDGYSDLIAAAETESYSGLTRAGAAHVFHGSAGGLEGIAQWWGGGNQDYSRYGWRATTAGDVNGDGYSDLLVSAPDYDYTVDDGKVEVYHGGPDNLVYFPAWSYAAGYGNTTLGGSVESAGDFNGDGYADFLVGAPGYDSSYTNEGAIFMWYGSVTGPGTGGPDWWAIGGQAEMLFGVSVSGVGDVDGDGYTDILAGAPSFDNIATDGGLAAFWYGGSGLYGMHSALNADWVGVSEQTGGKLGSSVSGAGDLNGDGYADIAVGVPGYSQGQDQEGAVFVWIGGQYNLGVSTIPYWQDQSDMVNGKLGTSVSSAGDVNGDGYSDLLVGGNNFAAAWYGSPTGLGSDGMDWFAAGFGAYDAFALRLHSAGDLNGDGYSDVVIGAPFRSNAYTNEGAAQAYCGSAAGLAASPCWVDFGGLQSAFFGFSVGSGDFNGDGYSDLAVGAPGWTMGHTGEGQLRVYYGSMFGPVSFNGGDWITEGDLAGGMLGYTIASAGDVNGDGYADLIAGQPGYASAGAEEGRALLFYGNGAPGRPFLPQQRRSDALTQIAPLGLASDNIFYVSGYVFSPTGMGNASLCVEVRTLLTSFNGNCTTVDNLYSTGLAGKPFQTVIVGLAPNQALHWRMRIHYSLVTNPFGPPNSRWVTRPWNGWGEADLRTQTLADKVYLPILIRQ